MSAGKGDKPRNCFSKQYKDNYDSIIWSKTKKCSKCENIMNNKYNTCPKCGYSINLYSER